jgi:hypothetical protein
MIFDKSAPCAELKLLRQSAFMKKKIADSKFESTVANDAHQTFEQELRRILGRYYISRGLFHKLTRVIERNMNEQEEYVERGLKLLSEKVDRIQLALDKHHGDR